jgi:transcriptional regulator with XRE-family HTH domain
MSVKKVNSELNKQIGAKLLRVRQRSGLSQQNVSFDLEFSPTTYSKLENGKVDFTVTRLKQFADYFIVNLSDFLDETVETPRLKSEVTFAKDYRDLESRYNQLKEILLEFQRK